MAYVVDLGMDVAWAGDFMGQGAGVAPRRGFSKDPKDWCGGHEHEQKAQGRKRPPELNSYGTARDREDAYFGTRGLGHWGLLAAFHKDLEEIGLRQDVLRKFRDGGAEHFLRTWEKAEYISRERLGWHDGFSIGSQPLVWLKQGFAKEGLPSLADPTESLASDSLVAIFDYESGERVPLFAEVDANGDSEEITALIIRPMRPFPSLKGCRISNCACAIAA